MFFVFSKVAGFFATPSNAMASVLVAGIVLYAIGRRRTGVWVILSGAALALLFGFSPLGNLMMLPLTERFPPWRDEGRAPDGIVILGGAIDADVSIVRPSIEVNSSAERVLAMLQLARRYPQARIVYSGGSGNLVSGTEPEAPVAERLLLEFGVDRSRIVLESLSRSTAENATFSRKLLAPKSGERWLLVTSAFHMPRAIGAFRAAGFDVEAYPVDWRTRGWSDAALPFEAWSAGLARTDVAAHEWVGLVAYWMTGRSTAFFPAPVSVVPR